MALESKFQKSVINELMTKYPGAIVLKNDANYIQGFPDLLFLYNEFWGALETKPSPNAPRRTNQLHWINTCNIMSFGSLVFPENLSKVLESIELEISSRPLSRNGWRR